jgi:hypothetical protein
MLRAKLPAESATKPCVAVADEYTRSGHPTAGVERKSNKAFTSHAARRERQDRERARWPLAAAPPDDHTTKTDNRRLAIERSRRVSDVIDNAFRDMHRGARGSIFLARCRSETLFNDRTEPSR